MKRKEKQIEGHADHDTRNDPLTQLDEGSLPNKKANHIRYRERRTCRRNGRRRRRGAHRIPQDAEG